MSREPVRLETSEPVVAPSLTSQNGHRDETLTPDSKRAAIAETLGVTEAELDAALTKKNLAWRDGQLVPLVERDTPSVEALLAGRDAWEVLDEIEKAMPLAEGETLARRRLTRYNEAIAAIAGEQQDATRSMLCKRAAEVFKGVEPAQIRADVQRLRPSSPDDKKLVLADPEPWPEKVDGAVLLHEIRQQYFEKYIASRKHVSVALTLWTVWTYAVEAFDIDVAPVLLLQSPEKRCGKSTVVEIMQRLVRRPVTAASVTSASIYRTIDKYTPTLLLDEFDKNIEDKKDLVAIVNSGHTRATGFAIRCEGDEHEPRRFSTFCAKAIAFKGKIPEQLDTVEDRSILIPMRRRTKDEDIEKWRRAARKSRGRGDFETLRRKIARWVADHAEIIVDEPQVPDGLDDRAEDNWFHLLAVAEAAGGDWPDRARRAALALSGGDARPDESRGVQLLADLRRCFSQQVDRLHTKALIERLVRDKERPWATWNHGKEITPVQIAALLRPFGIVPVNVRLDDDLKALNAGELDQAKGYKLDDCRDAFERYLPPPDAILPSQPSQSSNDAGLRPIREPSQDPVGTAVKSDVSAHEEKLGTGGTAKWAEQGGKSDERRREPVPREPVAREPVK